MEIVINRRVMDIPRMGKTSSQCRKIMNENRKSGKGKEGCKRIGSRQKSRPAWGGGGGKAAHRPVSDGLCVNIGVLSANDANKINERQGREA